MSFNERFNNLKNMVATQIDEYINEHGKITNSSSLASEILIELGEFVTITPQRYVVIGETGVGEEREKHILYVGDEKEKAFSMQPSKFVNHTLFIETHVKGQKVAEHYKEVHFQEWSVNFDLKAELENSIEERKKSLEKDEQTLESLRGFM